MRTSGYLILSLFFAFSFTQNLSSQTNQENLDQVKLVKQFSGTWVAQVGEDSVLHMKCVSLGEGLYMHGEWKTAGKPYYSAHSVIGFTTNKETVIFSAIWENGVTIQEIGRFVTEDKLVMERFRPDMPNHAVGLSEYDFSQPDKIIWRWQGRGAAVTWDPLWKSEATYTKAND